MAYRVTFPDKVTLEKLYADEVNQLKTVINKNAGELEGMLPAPSMNGVRTITVNFTVSSVVTLANGRGFTGPATGAGDRNFLRGNWEMRSYGSDADYRAFLDANGYGIVRKDYLQGYTVRLRTGSVLEFHEMAEWENLAGGSFSVDLATNPPKPGAVVCITLAAGATAPTLPASFILPPAGGAFVAGKEHRLMFNVLYDGRILYTITPLT